MSKQKALYRGTIDTFEGESETNREDRNSRCWVEGPGGKPQGDDEYFERMTRVVFQAGMNWRTIDAKWTGFREAFADFSIEKVAGFTDADIESLVKDRRIIRNRRKILATVSNAKELIEVIKEHGSVEAYIDSLDKSENCDRAAKELSKRFNHLGTMSALLFLFYVGVPMKGAQAAPWIARTKGKE